MEKLRSKALVRCVLNKFIPKLGTTGTFRFSNTDKIYRGKSSAHSNFLYVIHNLKMRMTAQPKAILNAPKMLQTRFSLHYFFLLFLFIFFVFFVYEHIYLYRPCQRCQRAKGYKNEGEKHNINRSSSNTK